MGCRTVTCLFCGVKGLQVSGKENEGEHEGDHKGEKRKDTASAESWQFICFLLHDDGHDNLGRKLRAQFVYTSVLCDLNTRISKWRRVKG
jgi:hypothetical protein